MKTINLQFIDSALGPLVGGADDDEQIEQYRNFDSENEYLIKDVIEKKVKVSFNNSLNPPQSLGCAE